MCDSEKSIFRLTNFTEVVNSLMKYVGGKKELLVFITIKKTCSDMPCISYDIMNDIAVGVVFHFIRSLALCSNKMKWPLSVSCHSDLDTGKYFYSVDH